MYRKCVGIMLINNKNEVFVGERIDIPGIWQMPQGGVMESEEEIQAVLRELEEETGIRTNQDIICALERPIQYTIPSSSLPSSWKGDFIGQSISFYLVKFSGPDSEINLSHWQTPEFRDYKWISIDDLEAFIGKHAPDFKREMYCSVVKTFMENIQIISSCMPVFNS